MDEIRNLLQAIIERLDRQSAEFNTFSTEFDNFRTEVNNFRIEVNQNFERLERQNNLIDTDIDFLSQKVAKNEREIHRLKQETLK